MSVESSGHAPVQWYRMREEWMRFPGVRFGTLRYVDKQGDEHISRVLRSRWFVVELQGSVSQFAENALGRVFAVVGLTESPREAADLVLSLSIREPELEGRMGELAHGLVSMMTKLKLVGEEGLVEISRKQVESEREMLEVALERMSEYCRNGGGLDPADIAAVLRECGMTPEDALGCLEVRFNLNGQAAEAVRVAYSTEREGVR